MSAQYPSTSGLPYASESTEKPRKSQDELAMEAAERCAQCISMSGGRCKYTDGQERLGACREGRDRVRRESHPREIRVKGKVA